MDILQMFDLADGTIIGQRHRETARNNQDASLVLRAKDGMVAVVADGCSSGKYSEVGARMGVQLTARSVADRIDCLNICKNSQNEFDVVAIEIAHRLKSWVDMYRLFGALSEEERCGLVRDHLLFTIVGVAITGKKLYLFNIGDGLVVVNGEIIRFGPFPDNAPPYIAYDLVSEYIDKDLIALSRRFKLREFPIEDVESIMIGTDGLADFMERADCLVNGKNELVGPVTQFVTDDKYFKNPDNVRRRLAIVNRETHTIEDGKLVKRNGLLPDDTTLIAIRRRKEI